jgi:hypothetical protein
VRVFWVISAEFVNQTANSCAKSAARLRLVAFTKSERRLRITSLPAEIRQVLAASAAGIKETHFMAATGELIRLINYVDDITTTLRRIHASLYGMEEPERKRLAESLRSADGKLRELLEQLEK